MGSDPSALRLRGDPVATGSGREAPGEGRGGKSSDCATRAKEVRRRL